MDVLILLEENRFENLANTIKKQCVGNVEINNIDYDLEKSLRNSNIVIYLGTNLEEVFFKQYEELLATKLLITTANELLGYCYIELKMKCKHNIAIFSVPNIEDEVKQVVSQMLESLFVPKYKVMMVEGNQFQTVVSELQQLEDQITDLVSNSQYENGLLLHFLHNFNK